MDEMELAGHALAHGAKGEKAPKPPKPMKEMHIKELHDKTYHVAMHSGKMGEPPKEGSAKDMDGVHDHVHEHFTGAPIAEAKKDEGEGEKAGGDEETAESKPGGGQGEGSHEEK